MVKNPVRFLFLSILFSGSIIASYPEKAITIVVHSKPGSAIDLTARQAANIGQKYTSVPILVENKTGGSGTSAMRYVKDKKPDGYYILGVTKSFISTVLLTPGIVNLADFNFFAGMVIDPEVLITNRNTKIQTLNDIIINAQKNPGQQRWLGPLVGGVDHLMAVKTWDILGIQGEWIPYEGGSDAIAALMGQHGVVYVGNPVDVKGRPNLKIAAVSADERLTEYPDTPTFLEMGYPITNDVLWRGFALHRDTKPEVLNYLTQLFQKISLDPEWKKFILSTGAQSVFWDSKSFNEIVQNDQMEATHYLQMAGILDAGSESSAKQQIGFLVILIIVFVIIILSLRRWQPEWLNGQMLIPLSIIFISIYLYSLTSGFPEGKLAASIGPASMPRLWIYGLWLFCTWSIVIQLRHPNSGKNTTSHLQKPLSLIGLMILYMLASVLIGYLLATFIFLILGIYLMGYYRHLTVWLVSLGFTGAAYLIFYKLLMVPLPIGKLFE